MTCRAVFLDRDGTLIEDPPPGYLGDPDQVKLLPNVGEVLFRLKNKFNFLLIVISNQSGIARSIITKEQVESVNSRINSILKNFKVSIDAFYYCPFHPDYSTYEESECRKPSPEMVFKAAKDFNIDLSESFFVGNTLEDVKCGINSGTKTILIKSGDEKDNLSILQKENNIPKFVANDFLEAGKFIINDMTGAAS
jgi:D,D-heptose 1,7-bisphosphate phosphatase